MGPEIYCQLIDSRGAELREKAADYRRVREALASRKKRRHGGTHSLRATFGKSHTI